MNSPSYFERLVETVTHIVRHPHFDTKPDVVDRCRTELADLNDAGRITDVEADVLFRLLDESEDDDEDDADEELVTGNRNDRSYWRL
jgi:hypothetical protein